MNATMKNTTIRRYKVVITMDDDTNHATHLYAYDAADAAYQASFALVDTKKEFKACRVEPAPLPGSGSIPP